MPWGFSGSYRKLWHLLEMRRWDIFLAWWRYLQETDISIRFPLTLKQQSREKNSGIGCGYKLIKLFKFRHKEPFFFLSLFFSLPQSLFHVKRVPGLVVIRIQNIVNIMLVYLVHSPFSSEKKPSSKFCLDYEENAINRWFLLAAVCECLWHLSEMNRNKQNRLATHDQKREGTFEHWFSHIF